MPLYDNLAPLSTDAMGLDEPAPESTEQSAPPDAETETPPEASDEAAAEAKTAAWMQDFSDAADPLDLLRRISKSVSREELLKDPTLAGIIGDQADRLERKRTADREKANQEEAERKAAEERQRRLEEAADDDDLLTLGELTKEHVLTDREKRIQANAEAERQAEAAQLASAVARGALDAFVDSRTPAVRTKLQQLAGTKAYSQEFNQGFQEWMADAVAAEVANAQSEWEKNLRESIRREVLGEIESEQESDPEVGGGSAASGEGMVTQAEWDANRRDMAWRMKNLDRLNRSIAAGVIRS